MVPSNYNNDVVYVNTFTPREYQVELLERAKNCNVIICSSTSASKSFLSVKLVQELSWQMRCPDGKKAFYILNPQNIEVLIHHLTMLTDLSVTTLSESITASEFESTMQKYNVFLLTLEACVDLLKLLHGDMTFLNLLVIDDGLYGSKENYITSLMQLYKQNITKPRIIGLVSGLLSEELKPFCLEAEMSRLEHLLSSPMDTSSDISALIRLSGKPKELIVMCKDPVKNPNIIEIREVVLQLQSFLNDHRYDPSEIYTDEFLDDFKNIPDPKSTPQLLLEQFLEILDDFGIWAANHAAFHIIVMIEKLKVKVAYERHYLLLCIVETTMLTVRSLCAELPQNCDNDVIQNYSTSKVKRLIEILKVMGPAEKPDVEPPQPPPEPPVVVKSGKRGYKGQRRPYHSRNQNDDTLCCLLFVQNTLMAKVFHSILSNLCQNDLTFWWMSPLYTTDKVANPLTEVREAEIEHRRQEEVLRKFRAHDCNVMIATSVLEQGYDLPKCNLVIRLDIAKTFHSYILSKSRARCAVSNYISLLFERTEQESIRKYSEYIEVENILLRKSGCSMSQQNDVSEADLICKKFAPYVTKENEMVHLTTAIQIINRYCAKLPSDTFTKLVPTYDIVRINNIVNCSLRLPINSPVKTTIVTSNHRNEVEAKRFAAYYMCLLLHKSNELDDFFNPITKESFNAMDEDWNDFTLEKEDECLSLENIDQRPGTTKRRQYYFKRVANSLQDCMPKPMEKTYFYVIVMTLTCPIPEEQNTRGRKIYPPEESTQGFGILTSKEIPQICPFPIFTRSGEVKVSLELCGEDIVLNHDQIHQIKEFLNYTFTSVLRLQKYQMLFNTSSSESSYFIVPTIKDDNNLVNIDWDFLDLIYKNRDVLPESIADEDRVNYDFDATHYKDAVVMPWYRNQDQPQYFYVAEICTNLNPSSTFPGSEYSTFEEYYSRKYGIKIQNKEQNLLDVDHTSARLNFLTPRYVNRKGVALPTSSEETKRAKRENLEQKQILVPELCSIHPFPASLWRKAVCLPCILYRVNALLLADQIRRKVAQEINLGVRDLPRWQNTPHKQLIFPAFKWDPLNFGWNLSDVLKKSRGSEKKTETQVEINSIISSILDDLLEEVIIVSEEMQELEIIELNGDGEVEKHDKSWMEIGTWSNDMVETAPTTVHTSVRYGSPTSWVHSTYGYNEYDDFSDSDTYYSSDDDDANDSQCGGLHIEFQGEYLAEAVDLNTKPDQSPTHDLQVLKAWDSIDYEPPDNETSFIEACNMNAEDLYNNAVLKSDLPVDNYLVNRPSDSKSVVPFGEKVVPNYEYLEPERKPAITPFRNLNLPKIGFSFDEQPDLLMHPGPSPSVILQGLTMSNANDGINLERLETIGDSFLKYAITDYLYSKYANTHEGKLSHLRSKQVSNLNLYRLGKKKQLGELMIASKFDPHDNWLPPCYCVSKELEEALGRSRIPGNYLTLADYVLTRNMSIEQICSKIKEDAEDVDDIEGIIPYNLVTQHSIPDKSIADCVEALIGAYLIECGPIGALLFMAWLGIRVLPKINDQEYGRLPIPDSPLLRHINDPEIKLEQLLDGYEKFEDILGYQFNDRSYLLQALTHASYFPNNVTDCYQRLEFLGDAVLDYLITRHLYEDQRMHSPGALTDLRSALVNNTIFASLAVKYNFHKYFRYLSPGLHQVIEKFIRIQQEMGHKVSEELFLLDVEDNDEVEDIEVPKVLGDIFESVAGAIFLDSGRSLDAVWTVYYQMMKSEIEQFSDKVPKSPIRELLELEPETAKFGPAEKLADGRRVRVAVEVFGKGVFRGIGRNYRIAKCTAAKCALKHLKKQSTYPHLI